MYVPNSLTEDNESLPTCSNGDAIHLLSVDIPSIPGVGELDAWVSLKLLLKKDALNRNLEVNKPQGQGNGFWGKLELNGGQVATCTAAVVDKVQGCSRNGDALLYDLKCET